MNGGDLLTLVSEAAARGARHVELRMGSLGTTDSITIIAIQTVSRLFAVAL